VPLAAIISTYLLDLRLLGKCCIRRCDELTRLGQNCWTTAGFLSNSQENRFRIRFGALGLSLVWNLFLRHFLMCSALCTEEQLVDALTGRAQPLRRHMLALQLPRLQSIDQQIARLSSMIDQAMKTHQDAVIRLAEVPSSGVDSAQHIIAEVGAQASTRRSLTSWVRTCTSKSKGHAASFLFGFLPSNSTAT
jgi:hypothetical protein